MNIRITVCQNIHAVFTGIFNFFKDRIQFAPVFFSGSFQVADFQIIVTSLRDLKGFIKSFKESC